MIVMIDGMDFLSEKELALSALLLIPTLLLTLERYWIYSS